MPARKRRSNVAGLLQEGKHSQRLPRVLPHIVPRKANSQKQRHKNDLRQRTRCRSISRTITPARFIGWLNTSILINRILSSFSMHTAMHPEFSIPIRFVREYGM